MESPPIGIPLREPQTWYDTPLQLSKIIGCENYTDSSILQCWQSVNWKDILTAQSDNNLKNGWPYGMPYTPTAGTDLIPYQPVQAFMNDSYSMNVPTFIIGVNNDEGNLFLNDSFDYTFQYVYYGLAASFGIDNADMIIGMIPFSFTIY